MTLPARLRQKIPAPIKRVLRPLKKLVTTKGKEELAYWKSLTPQPPEKRDAYYRKYLLAVAGEADDSFLAGKVIADFGCGPAGSLTWAKSASARIGIDVLSDLYVDEFRDCVETHGMVYVKSTERTIPLPTGFVDVMFTLNAMDHVNDFPQMCQELVRAMKPGGLFIGSFNLGEDPTICEPQRLTEQIIRTQLLDQLEVNSCRSALKGPADNLYGRLLQANFSEPVPAGQEGFLWVRAPNQSEFETRLPGVSDVQLSVIRSFAEAPMPNYFPCPNAQCTYQFDADILPPAAMVTCPLCRTKFPYRVNRPVTAAAPAGTDGAPPPMGQSHFGGGRVLNIREVPKGGGVLTTVLWVGGFCVVLGILLVGLMMKGRQPDFVPSQASDQKFNIKVDPFPNEWVDEPSASKPVDANIFGKKRSGPDGYVAVVAQEFGEHGDRQPRAGELDALMRGRMVREEGFKNRTFEDVDGEKWSGHPALAVRFTADLNDTAVRGEAFAISYKGIGYVFYIWASETDWGSIRGEVANLRDRVKLGEYRENWVEKRANTQVYTVEGAAYQVEDIDGVWVRGKPADQWSPKDKRFVVDDIKEVDPNATMAFMAEYHIRERGDSHRKPATADALVVGLPSGGDPLDTAKAHAVERTRKAFTSGPIPDVKLEPMMKSPAGVALPTGGPAIVRLQFRNPWDREDRWMHVISAISLGGKTIAVETRCREADASYVEEWMVHLAGSLKAK